MSIVCASGSSPIHCAWIGDVSEWSPIHTIVSDPLCVSLPPSPMPTRRHDDEAVVHLRTRIRQIRVVHLRTRIRQIRVVHPGLGSARSASYISGLGSARLGSASSKAGSARCQPPPCVTVCLAIYLASQSIWRSAPAPDRLRLQSSAGPLLLDLRVVVLEASSRCVREHCA